MGGIFFISFELTASVTALANLLAEKLDDKEAALLAAILVQLGDTLATIAVQKDLCSAGESSKIL